MTSEKVFIRILTTYLCFLIVFNLVAVVSYYLLPAGLLRNKNPLHSWDTSPDMLVSTLQIFFYNLLSVIALVLANLFAIRNKKSNYYMPLGYTCFFVMICINAIILGTWSFSVVTDPVPLADRILRTFDLCHRAGLWEMSGQLFILCATTKISVILTSGNERNSRHIRTLKLSKPEIACIAVGILLMLTGAFIESYSIINLK